MDSTQIGSAPKSTTIKPTKAVKWNTIFLAVFAVVFVTFFILFVVMFANVASRIFPTL